MNENSADHAAISLLSAANLLLSALKVFAFFASETLLNDGCKPMNVRAVNMIVNIAPIHLEYLTSCSLAAGCCVPFMDCGGVRVGFPFAEGMWVPEPLCVAEGEVCDIAPYLSELFELTTRISDSWRSRLELGSYTLEIETRLRPPSTASLSAWAPST